MDERIRKLKEPCVAHFKGLSVSEIMLARGTIDNINSMQTAVTGGQHFIVLAVVARKNGVFTTKVVLENGCSSTLQKEDKLGATVELDLLDAHLRASGKNWKEIH